jgi:hypothetical protein
MEYVFNHAYIVIYYAIAKVEKFNEIRENIFNACFGDMADAVGIITCPSCANPS